MREKITSNNTYSPIIRTLPSSSDAPLAKASRKRRQTRPRNRARRLNTPSLYRLPHTHLTYPLSAVTNTHLTTFTRVLARF